MTRTRLGWVNDLSHDQFEEVAEAIDLLAAYFPTEAAEGDQKAC